MFSPYVFQLISNKDVREFSEGVPRNTKDRENAGRNKFVLLAVLSFLDGRSSCTPTQGELMDRAGLSASSLKNALHALRRLDLLSILHRPGLPSLIALGGHFDSLFGPVNDE